MSGLPQYVIDEIERCMKILGTPRDNFKTLEQRRVELIIKEFQKIQNDPTNPCNKLVPQPSTHEHDLRIRSKLPYVIISYTKRHQQSFTPRAIIVS